MNRGGSKMEPQIKKIFIGSSDEGRKYADSIVRILHTSGADPFPWWDPSRFPANLTVIESLEIITRSVNGAILVVSPDDTTTHRGNESFTPRMNVVLEYGLFLGRLSRSQVGIALVEGTSLPSDLAGVNYIPLPPMQGGRADAVFEARAAPSVNTWLDRLSDAPDVVRSLSPHLDAIYDRSNGRLRVIIPAFPAPKGGASDDTKLSPTDTSMLTMMTSLEGMAYGWLLRAFSPIIRGGQEIQCLTPNQGGADATGGTATFVIGGPSTNEETRNIFLRMLHPDMATEKAGDYGDVITYKGKKFETQFQNGFRAGDFSFLLYRPDYELFVCAGTSPFGTAGAVSMLTEPREGIGVQDIPELIINRKQFLAIGNVDIISPTFWKFKSVIDIYVESNGAGGS